jgi:hypothetical protein
MSALPSTFRGMSWLWVLVAMAATWFMISVFVTGALAFRAPEWSEAFHHFAFLEARRRGLADRKWSVEEGTAIAKMAGPEPVNLENVDMEIEALAVLSGNDLKELAVDISARREALLGRMLDRQLGRVEHVDTIRWTARIWVIQKFFSRLEVAIRGVVWLVPRCLTEIVNIIKSPSPYLGVIAGFLGLAYWLLVRGHDGAEPDPLTTLGSLTKIIPIAVLLWAIGVLLFRLLVLRFGTPSSWSRRAVVTTSVAIPTTVILAAVAQFVSNKLGEHVHVSLDRVDNHDPTTIRITAAAMAIGFLWLIQQPLRNFLSKELLTSDRIGSLSAIATLVSFSTFLLGLAVWGSMPEVVRVAGLTVFGIALCLGFVSCVFSAIEWVRRCRSLARTGIEVPRRGCHWWLGTLIAAWVGLAVLSSIHALVSAPIVQLALVFVGLVAFVSIWPAAITTWLFVRRVNTYFERHQIIHSDDPVDDKGDEDEAA